MFACLINVASSLVEIEKSTSGLPSTENSALWHSYFLARHGIIDTTTISFRFIPILSAKYVLAIAPNICCGDFAVDGTSLRSGKYSSKKLTQPGQQDVSMGIFAVVSPFRCLLSLSRSSVPSSITVSYTHLTLPTIYS